MRPFSWAAAERLSRTLGVPFVVAAVLVGRGFADIEAARAFLDGDARVPSPFLFGHMVEAVEQLGAAIDGGLRVVVHGDYDADGVTATAVMVEGLATLGLQAEWYLPSRFKEGYGLSREAVDTIAAGGPGLLVTVDCGVNYPDEVALAKEKGLEVVVIDHHQPGPVLPSCPLIHPAVGEYPHGDLCGVGLALKVLHGLEVARHAASETEVPEELRRFLDLVAIGTIADLAPLRGENRHYIKEGLKLISIGARPGLRALTRVSDCTGQVDSSTVAFRLAPRLNAAGRLKDPSPPLRLLLTGDEREALAIAGDLHKLNGERQEVERQILEQAVSKVESLAELPAALVLAGEGWHEGVIGIVASRLVERYGRPTVLLGVREGVAKGSGRSVPGYDLMAGLNACARLLTIYGGHPQAVGLTLAEGGVSEFASALAVHAFDSLGTPDLAPVYRADAVMRGEDLNADTALALAALGPFGSGNPRPRLLVVGARILNPESTRTGSHLRCVVEVDGVHARAIGFGMADKAAALQLEGEGLTLGVQLQADQWQGTVRPQLQLERISGTLATAPADLECGPECREWGLHSRTTAAVPVETVGEALAATPDVRSLPGCVCRDEKGRLSSIAQVLSTGEPAFVVTSSIPHLVATLRRNLPLHDLIHRPITCVGQGCGYDRQNPVEGESLFMVEWDALEHVPLSFSGTTHAILADPPYRLSHMETLRQIGDRGVIFHQCYGDEERRATAELLRYLGHPRFAMVSVYRAAEAGFSGEERLAEAARLAMIERGIVLAPHDLVRAEHILACIGMGLPESGQAKMDTKDVAAYAQAEAEFKESVRLCRIL